MTTILPQTNENGQHISIVCQDGPLLEIPVKTKRCFLILCNGADPHIRKHDAHLPMMFLPSVLAFSYSSLSTSERVTCCTNTLLSGNWTTVRPATLLVLVRLSVIPLTRACRFLQTHTAMVHFGFLASNDRIRRC